MPVGITDLPIETVEHIVAAVNSPTDLENLAAVCTQLRSITVPNHTQYRIIRTPLNTPLWKELAENRLRAQNVRILEVQEDYVGDDQVIPTIYSTLEVQPVPDLESFENVEAVRNYFAEKNAKDLEAERFLVSALKEMSGLTSFQWTRTPPLINRNQEDDIWITLANHCPSLNVINVNDAEKPYVPLLDEPDDPAYQRPTHNPNFYLFKDLIAFSFTTLAFNFGSFPRPIVEQCAKMLNERCRNLELLILEYVLDRNPDTKTISASPLLSGQPWNSLRQLTLLGFEFDSVELIFFLAAHPTIEFLLMYNCEIDHFTVLHADTHVLPRLKRLAVVNGAAAVVNAILGCTTPIPRPLKHIEGLLLDDSSLDLLQQCGSGPTLGTLTALDDGGSDFGRLMLRLPGIVPNLEWLEIRPLHVNTANNRTIDRNLYPVFGQFPRLQTLKGMQFIRSCCQPASDNTERIQALVTLCPNLEYIGGQIDPPNTDFRLAVIIERHGSHRTWSLYRTEGEAVVGVYEHWGARGQGCFEL